MIINKVLFNPYFNNLFAGYLFACNLDEADEALCSLSNVVDGTLGLL